MFWQVPHKLNTTFIQNMYLNLKLQIYILEFYYVNIIHQSNYY